jgi:hypothetical protein
VSNNPEGDVGPQQKKVKNNNKDVSMLFTPPRDNCALLNFQFPHTIKIPISTIN